MHEHSAASAGPADLAYIVGGTSVPRRGPTAADMPYPPTWRRRESRTLVCMIAHRPVKGDRGSNIPQQVIDTAIGRHPDGFGVAWREGGTLRHVKYGPAEKATFANHLRDLDKHSDREYVAHWRFATHGPEDQAHAHPYEYTDPQEGQVLVFHNGVIDIATNEDESDTQAFVERVLTQLPSAWWRMPVYTYLVGEAVGWSKLVLMTETETVNLHEARGKWDGGIWYSSNHKPDAWDKSKYGRMPAPYASAHYTPALTPGGTAVTAANSQLVATSQEPALVGKRKAGKHKGKRIVTVKRTSGTVTRVVDRPLVLRHGGHELTALQDIDRSKDGDYIEGVICDTCYTIGDVYVIEGGLYIDMAHVGSDEAREEDALVTRAMYA